MAKGDLPFCILHYLRRHPRLKNTATQPGGASDEAPRMIRARLADRKAGRRIFSPQPFNASGTHVHSTRYGVRSMCTSITWLWSDDYSGNLHLKSCNPLHREPV